MSKEVLRWKNIFSKISLSYCCCHLSYSLSYSRIWQRIRQQQQQQWILYLHILKIGKLLKKWSNLFSLWIFLTKISNGEFFEVPNIALIWGVRCPVLAVGTNLLHERSKVKLGKLYQISAPLKRSLERTNSIQRELFKSRPR